jgi:hypothetical protein
VYVENEEAERKEKRGDGREQGPRRDLRYVQREKKRVGLRLLWLNTDRWEREQWGKRVVRGVP